jgi:MFS family permease
VLAGAHAAYPACLAPFILAGVGVSMVLPTAPAAALNAVPPASPGKASAVVNSLRQFGGVSGIAIVTAVFTTAGSLTSPAAVTAGFRQALVAAAAFSALGAAAARRRAPCPRQGSRPGGLLVTGSPAGTGAAPGLPGRRPRLCGRCPPSAWRRPSCPR